MATTNASRTYATSEFTGAGGDPNVEIFAAEVGELALSAQPTTVSRAGTSVSLTWNGLPTAADLALIDAAVVAHTGGAFAPDLQSAVVEAAGTNATTTEDVRVTLTTGKLPAGAYQVVWSAEIAVDAVVANTGCQLNFYIQKNGGARVERGQGVVSAQLFDTRAAVAYLEGVEAGDNYTFELGYKKVGASANIAKIQSARLYLKPLEA